MCTYGPVCALATTAVQQYNTYLHVSEVLTCRLCLLLLLVAPLTLGRGRAHTGLPKRGHFVCSVGACCVRTCVFQLFEMPRLATALGGSSLVNGVYFLYFPFSKL